MGKIYGKNLWGKLMGKINEENLWGKLIVLFTIALQTYCNFFPLTAIKEMGIKDMGIFNGTLSHNGKGKKYVN